MKFEFPDTGEGVTEGKFLEWLVEKGDSVEEDQAVAEVETDKAVIDVPAPSDGVIKELMASPGDTVKVGEVIMELDTGEDVAEAESEDEEEEKDSEQSEDQDNSEENTEEISQMEDADVLALPKVRKLARDKNVALSSLEVEGRITEKDVLEASDNEKVKEEPETEKAAEKEVSQNKVSDTEESSERNEKASKASVGNVKATPATRKLAREKGVNLDEIEGTGRGGKITRSDVENADNEDKTEQDKKSESVEKKITGDSERIEMSGIRKTVGQRMKESVDKIPHVTHMDKADITELYELRERKKDEVDVHLTYLPFIMKAASEALKHHPDLNAELDVENDEIIRYSSHDFNMAVDTENGLMVPLIENISEKNILEIASDIIEKAEKAREMDLSRDEMKNGTFSVTNVGAIGGEFFTPIIDYPQVAILGIGRIQQTAEVIDGEVKPRWTVKLSLSYDHRVVDGADAARFMNKIIENLEDPESMILRL